MIRVLENIIKVLIELVKMVFILPGMGEKYKVASELPPIYLEQSDVLSCILNIFMLVITLFYRLMQIMFISPALSIIIGLFIYNVYCYMHYKKAVNKPLKERNFWHIYHICRTAHLKKEILLPMIFKKEEMYHLAKMIQRKRREN